MKTLTESIPTVFKPETTFTLAVQQEDAKSTRANEAFIPHRITRQPEDHFIGLGIPWSAIHD